MELRPARRVSLLGHPEVNERWLQEQIANDPTLLGLGDLDVRDMERRQPGAGRLDLLLSDPETLDRYEVEIQLGATACSTLDYLGYGAPARSRYSTTKMFRASP